MTPEKFSGTIGTAYGVKVSPELKFEGTFDAFESYEEAKAANELLSNDEILNAVNAKRKAAKRAEVTTEVLNRAGYKKPDANDPATIKANMVKLVAKMHSISEVEALQLVEAIGSAVTR